jgi:hypothetical protein
MRQLCVPCLILLLSTFAHADGVVVDKVYHPYVLPNEREVEWRFASDKTDQGSRLMQRLGFGHSLSDTLSIELYAIGERNEEDAFELAAFEAEARWMLTEQGQYWADWGLLFELERQRDANNWEASAAVLSEKEFGRTSLTINLFAVYEWGDQLESEWETEFRLKYRYRWLPQLQPAIELYAGEDYWGIGPAFMGIQRFNGQRQLKWEAGLIEEVSQGDIGRTFRLALEYEF